MLLKIIDAWKVRVVSITLGLSDVARDTCAVIHKDPERTKAHITALCGRLALCLTPKKSHTLSFNSMSMSMISLMKDNDKVVWLERHRK